MIIGIGSDLIDIRRVEKVMGRYEKRFIERCFTDVERAKAERRREAGTHIDTYAKRFAAKMGFSISVQIMDSDLGTLRIFAGEWLG